MEQQEILLQYLSFLLKDYKANLVGLLNKHGYATKENESSTKLQEKILLAISENEDFLADLEALIRGSLQVEQKHLQTTPAFLNADGSIDHSKLGFTFGKGKFIDINDNSVTNTLRKVSDYIKSSPGKIKSAMQVFSTHYKKMK